jgi:HPt (histidine-containing phosphotransfer) domain-containing protein
MGTNAQPSLQSEVIDSLRELGADDPTFFASLLNLFLQSVPNRIHELRQAIDLGQPLKVKAEAHTLKSSAGNIGAMRMSALCRDLEMLAFTGSLTGAAQLQAELEAEFNRVRAEIQALPELQRSAA